MRRAAFATIACATAAAAGAVVALASCNSDKLAGCTLAAVFTATPFAQVAVKDSIPVYAVTISDCPDKIGRAVDFSVRNPNLASVRATSDSTAFVRGVAVGETMVYLTPRDYHENRDSITLTVIGENP